MQVHWNSFAQSLTRTLETAKVTVMTNDTNYQKSAPEQIADEARKATESVKSEASRLADEAKGTAHQHAENQFEKGQSIVTSQVDTLSSAIEDAATTLNEQDHPLGHYTKEIADSMSGLSQKISNSSLDELASDTRQLARENPGLFMLGSIAVGVAASRFFKATTDRSNNDYDGRNTHVDSEYGRSQSRYESDGYERNQSDSINKNRYASPADERSPTQEFSPEKSGAASAGSTAFESSEDTVNISRVNEPISAAEKSAEKDVNVTSAEEPERV